jgi:hypothetical protein
MREGEVIRNPEAETAGIDSRILEGRNLERRNPEERREIYRGLDGDDGVGIAER